MQTALSTMVGMGETSKRQNAETKASEKSAGIMEWAEIDGR
jgi:hypothetical protein